MVPTMGEVFVRLATTAIDGDEAQTLLNRHAIDDDGAEAEKHVRVLRRKQTLVGRAALRRLLADATGIAGARWRLTRDPNGRPVAQHPDGGIAPEISLSHSGRWAACAVASTGSIGIDIEVPNGRRDANGIASFLSDTERMAVAREGEAALLDFWTMREALAKASGGTVLNALALDGSGLIAARNRVSPQSIDGRDYAIGQLAQAAFHIAIAWWVPRRNLALHLDCLASEHDKLVRAAEANIQRS
jgi:phosphopantetheinyl transferase